MFLYIILISGLIGLSIYLILPFVVERFQSKQKLQLEKYTQELPRSIRETEKKKYSKLFMVLPPLTAAAIFITTKNILFSFGGIFVGIIFAGIILKASQAKRRAKFISQILDILMIISGCLKAGLSLTQSLENIAQEMPSPAKEEFSLIMRENNMGIPLEESLLSLKNRIKSDELDLVITSILVSRETGGDLTQVFSQLVLTIRERDKLERRVRVLTTQGRLQGWIMGMIPIVFAIFIYKTSPQSFQTMLNDSMGRMLLIWAAISEVLGIFFIAKLSKVEV